MSANHPALQPLPLDALSLPNRFVVAPMTRISARPDGTPTAEMASYYRGFAEGGFGLVVTEGIHTDHVYSQGYLNQPGLVTAEAVQGWRAVTDAVHAAGAAIVAQLMHAGALSQGNPYRQGTLGPSAVQPLGAMLPDYGGSGPWPVPRAADRHDLETAVEGFVAASCRAVEAGFDGIEVHAANGYLLDQFVTDYTNLRQDEYGGSAAARIRLTAEVVEAIRAATPPSFVVGVRLSQTKVNDVEYRWSGASDAQVIFERVAAAGADYLHIASEGRSWFETATLPEGTTLTKLAREVTGLPVIANGGMHDVDQAARVLDGGHADLLSIGTGALANPDLPLRLSRNLPLDAFDLAMIHPDVTLKATETWRRAV